MKIRLLLLAAAIVCVPHIGFAQQEPQYTHYMFNQLLFNPAYAGARETFCGGLLYHNQWSQFRGIVGEKPPVTVGLNAHTPFRLDDRSKLGLGLTVMQDDEGAFRSTIVAAQAAYRRMFNFAELAVGLNFGGHQRAVRDPDWRYPDPGDPRIPAQGSGMGIDLGGGIWLKNPKYYVGISYLHANNPTINLVNYEYNQVAVMYFTAGYSWKPGFLPETFEIQPSTLIKKDVAKWQYDVNALVLYRERFVGGLGYRLEDALSLMLGAYVFNTPRNSLYIGYSHDITTSQMRGTGNVHEFMVRYCQPIGFGDPRSVIIPRDTRHL